ncbi:MAG: response regulator [Bryobacteraceae bacterium]|jgi:PAS domain S-box-containing protein
MLDTQLLTWGLILVATIVLIAYARRAKHSDADSSALGPTSLYDDAPVGYLDIDMAGVVRRVNRKECELRGLAAAEMVGKHLADLNPSNPQEQLREVLDRKLTQQISVESSQRRLQRQDGTLVIIEVAETLLRGPSGDVTGMRMVSTDVTDRHKSQEEATKIASELKAFFKAFPDLFLGLDADGKVVDCNGGNEKDPLLDPRTYSGRRLQDVLPPDVTQLVLQAIAKVRHTNAVEVMEFSIDARRVQQSYECRVLPLYWDRVIAVLRNISDRKAAAERLAQDAQELERKNEQLESALTTAREATQLKSRFVATMSHEIRTPMNGVLGMTDLLMGTELTPEQYEFASSIKHSADSLLTIVNDILDLSKMEAGKLRLDRIPFRLSVTVEELCSLFTLRARAKGLNLSASIPPGFSYSTVGDPGRLRQVLTNLLGNAIKFTDRGEIGLAVEVVRETPESLTVRFHVRDTGIGIPKDQQRQLFQSFTQLDGSSSRKYGGTGLGLAISKQLVELLGGEIGVNSEPNRGSTFWFTAVFERQAGEEPPSPASSKSEATDVSFKNLRVLIAAEKSTASVAKQLLESWGCQPQEVLSGEAVVPALKEASALGRPFRLLLADIDLRDLHGATISREPAAADVHLIAMTSAPFRGDGIELRESGFAGYLRKPIQPNDVYNTMSAVLKSAKSTASATAAPLITRHTISDQQANGSDQNGTAHGAAAQPSSNGVRLARILLAEDNMVNQRITLRLLEKLGVKAEAVVNGREAVEAVAKTEYDLVLMDCQMPEMDGYEATAKIRNAERNIRHTPVCALTANAMEGDREKCLAAGMDDYVAKPIGLEQLRETVVRWTQKTPAASRS